MDELIVTKPVNRRVAVNVDLLASSVNKDMDSADPEIRKAAREQAIKIELLNQKDEQHRDIIGMDERRNRILALLGGGTTGPDRLEAQPGGKRVARLGNSKSPSRKPARKNKGRKPRQT
jgi:hypothetical protein